MSASSSGRVAIHFVMASLSARLRYIMLSYLFVEVRVVLVVQQVRKMGPRIVTSRMAV